MTKTVVYKDGGTTWLGDMDKTPAEFKMFGKTRGQKYMYSGYKLHQGVVSNETSKRPVVVFDMESWSAAEKAKRKENGFLGIKQTKL